MQTKRDNRHRRKAGRGVRPWLLLPKVIAVAICLGGWTATLAVCFLALGKAKATGEGVSDDLLAVMHVLIVYITVPALLAAIVFGLLLFLQHPRSFLRMRWLWVKLVILAVGVPTAHLLMYHRFQAVRLEAESTTAQWSALRHFTLGLAWVLAGTIVVVLLGRLKPRLGQNWAKSSPKPK